MDDIIHFVFWGVIEHVFFRIGRFFLRCVTLGRVKLEKPTPIKIFLVALIGVAVFFLGIVCVYIIFGYLR